MHKDETVTNLRYLLLWLIGDIFRFTKCKTSQVFSNTRVPRAAENPNLSLTPAFYYYSSGGQTSPTPTRQFLLRNNRIDSSPTALDTGEESQLIECRKRISILSFIRITTIFGFAG